MSRRPTLVVMSSVVLATVIATFLLLCVSVVDEVVGGNASQLFEQSTGGGGDDQEDSLVDENEEINLDSDVVDREERQVNGTVRSTTRELIEKMAETLGARKFVNEYLLRSGVLNAMLPNQSYLVMVPEDRAMDEKSARANELLSTELDEIVGFHVVLGDLEQLYANYIMSYANQLQRLPTITGQNIFFHWRLNDNVLLASGSWVMDAIQKENIAVLKVEQLLLPPARNGDLWNLVENSPKLSQFVQLVKFANMQVNFTFPVQYTLFAPSNEAFNELDEVERKFLNQDRRLARRFVMRHLCLPMMFKSTVVWTRSVNWEEKGLPEMKIRNLFYDETHRFKQSTRDAWYTLAKFDINGVELPKENELATNGVMYIINGVL